MSNCSFVATPVQRALPTGVYHQKGVESHPRSTVICCKALLPTQGRDGTRTCCSIASTRSISTPGRCSTLVRVPLLCPP